MKLFSSVLVGLLLACSTFAGATEVNDFNFQQDRMALSAEAIYIVSTFNDQDHLTAYSYDGYLQWNKLFHAKIIAWQIADDYLFVFSKCRTGTKTYLTCIERHSGRLIWQKP